ncbi:hypothetical protein Dfri01_67870 [Dyadobacter frigoris]|uniref:hypothetical protein n=1 Tax=Dyadobacter frigoris TaxID=2576211 RepID=UPI0024A08FE0|nr:hypothetical protein [Dyadobacter frigoris]GLU57326.1 hypothetical protein Dfri01_67870 [Dyadobacter frigoris]
MKNLFLAIVYTWLLISCSGNNQQKVESGITSEENHPTEKLYGISKDEVFLLTGPDIKAAKIINQKATEALHETHYISVDKSVKVAILEKQNGWVKVQVIDPDWLKNTHIGWLEDKFLGDFDSIDPKRGTPVKLMAFAEVEKLRTSLTNNGIGQLHSWKHVDGGDWQAITDYYEVGRELNAYGLRNNLAYYLTSPEEGFAESLELVLNINVPSEREYALKQMKIMVKKTFKSIGESVPEGLLKAVDKQSKFSKGNDRMIVTLKTEKTKIATLILAVKTR